jgi:hypothetical protein
MESNVKTPFVFFALDVAMVIGYGALLLAGLTRRIFSRRVEPRTAEVPESFQTGMG